MDRAGTEFKKTGWDFFSMFIFSSIRVLLFFTSIYVFIDILLAIKYFHFFITIFCRDTHFVLEGAAGAHLTAVSSTVKYREDEEEEWGGGRWGDEEEDADSSYIPVMLATCCNKPLNTTELYLL